MKERAEITDCPRVSIITPFLNNEAFLSETIESVIAQTFKNWEYFLVDDGSGPEATAIAKRYAARYPRQIRYLEHPEHLNRGISATRNLGVKNAHGEFIAFLDSDDIWLPSKLAEHVALLDANQEVGMVCGATIEWNSWSTGPDCILPTGHRQDVVIYPPEAAVELFPLGKARAPSFSDVVFRAELVRRLGGFEERFTELYDDQVLLSKVYLSTPVYFCSKTSNKYRQHPTSTCAKATREGRVLQSKLEFLEWVEQYLKTIDIVDPRVVSSLNRKLRPYRSPRIHYFLSVIAKSRMVGRLRIRTRLRSVVHRIRPPKPMPLILMYHRIANQPVDPWGLAVSPAHFEQHLHVLRRTRHPLPLTDFVSGLLAGTLPPDAVAVTFDDGYVDNLVAAKALLASADIPATLFLPTGFMNRSGPFWWDELATFILGTSTPQNFELVVGDESIRIKFGTESAELREGTTLTSSSHTRQVELRKIWQVLRRLEDEELQAVMVKLRSLFAGSDRHASLGRAMTVDEVRTIASDGLVTIGAHTVTHPLLPCLEAAACHCEIIESKLACEALIGAPVATFAYPYGAFDAKVREAVKTAGFTVACSIQHGPAMITSDILALPRIHVRNVQGDAFEQALRLASALG